MSSSILLGVDIGTNAAKVSAFAPDGTVVGYAQCGYPTHRPQPLCAEQDPNDWWWAFRSAMQELSSSDGLKQVVIGAIGVAGQTNGHVLLKTDGSPLGRAIVWQDRRAIEQANWLQQTFSHEDRERFLGVVLPLDSSTIPARMLWLKQHQANELAQARAVLQPKDYLNFRLTGQLATDVVSCKTIVNLITGRFDPVYFDILGISPELFPTPVSPVSIVGVTQDHSDIGLPAGIPVVAGTIDAWANILGSGVCEVGQASEIAGTSEVISVIGDHIVSTDRFNVIPSFDRLILNGPTQAGAGSLDWFAAVIYASPPGTTPHNRDQLYAKWFQEVQTVPQGLAGLVFLPYLQGERTPIWDSRARGAFVGLSLIHEQRHLVRAVLEGVAFNVRYVLETIERIGNIKVESIHISGGGAKSDTWNQIKADITGKELHRPFELETCALGAAMLAGIGTGIYKSYKDAATRAVRFEKSYLPNPDSHAAYQTAFEVFCDLYPRLKDVFHRMS